MNISATKIDVLIADQGLSRKEYADKCGVSRQYITAVLKRGTCQPKTAGMLAKALGVSVSDII